MRCSCPFAGADVAVTGATHLRGQHDASDAARVGEAAAGDLGGVDDACCDEVLQAHIIKLTCIVA